MFFSEYEICTKLSTRSSPEEMSASTSVCRCAGMIEPGSSAGKRGVPGVTSM